LKILYRDIQVEQLKELEIKTVKELDTMKNGYNTLPGGDLSYYGIPLTEEHKQQISLSQKGKITSEDVKKKISIAKLGTKLSEEAKQKLSKFHQAGMGELNHFFGKTHSEESRQKMSESQIKNAINKQKTHCKNGHEYTEENTYIWIQPNGRPARRCKICNKNNKQKYKRRNYMSNPVTDEFGNKRWYQYGLEHREDGPAFIWRNGTKFWMINGKLHREDGPAYKMALKGGGYNIGWYINGKRII
jgi:hypothetical protein